jgi:hypothetical protein
MKVPPQPREKRDASQIFPKEPVRHANVMHSDAPIAEGSLMSEMNSVS